MKSLDNSWTVYILRCADNTLYTGVTNQPDNRLHQHNHTNKGAKYTRSRRPVELVYSEGNLSHSQSLKKEYQIKRLSRQQKLALIKQKGHITG
jgi:putative endonuclease